MNTWGTGGGVTVEKKVGMIRNKKGMMIDLPGVYTLSPLSRDEGVVTDFLLHEPFTEVLNIVDASQLKRNLHLTVQLLEFGKPLTIGLNMTDVAEADAASSSIMPACQNSLAFRSFRSSPGTAQGATNSAAICCRGTAKGKSRW